MDNLWWKKVVERERKENKRKQRATPRAAPLVKKKEGEA